MFKGTTICAVKKDGKCAIAGDGQVTMSEQIIMKASAKKVRRLYGGKVVVGFAGSVADAFSLCDRFEAKLEEYGGSLSFDSNQNATRFICVFPRKDVHSAAAQL